MCLGTVFHTFELYKQNYSMVAIEEGTEYRLFDFKSKESSQVIRFTSKDPITGDYIPGTTNEEVIEMMIDRFIQLNKKHFSVENQMIIENLKHCRELSRKRLDKKKQRLAKTHGANFPKA